MVSMQSKWAIVVVQQHKVDESLFILINHQSPEHLNGSVKLEVVHPIPVKYDFFFA